MSIISSQLSQDFAYRSGSSATTSPRPSTSQSHIITSSPRLSVTPYERLLSVTPTRFSPSIPATYGQSYLSDIETAILRSIDTPVEVNETEELTVLGQRGIWANKAEVVNWKGILPIESYLINEDADPEILNKRVKIMKY